MGGSSLEIRASIGAHPLQGETRWKQGSSPLPAWPLLGFQARAEMSEGQTGEPDERDLSLSSAL